MKAPEVAHLSWGTLRLASGEAFKDAKLWPGGGREWDWGETGTRHVPGIQPADVEELLAQGARVVVLSRGMNEVLQVPDETVAWLEDQGVTVHVAQTEAAVALYNELRSEHAVGALIHSTC